MAKFNKTVITEKGIETINDVINDNGSINFTCYKISDQKYSFDALETLADITAKTIIPLSSVSKTEYDTVEINALLSNEGLDEGYFIETIGLYAKDKNDVEFLYSVTTAEVSDFLPPNESINISDIFITLNIKVGNSEMVTIEKNTDGVVYTPEFNSLEKRVTTNEKDIKTINTNLVETNQSIVDTNVRIDNLDLGGTGEVDLSGVESRIGVNETDISDLKGRTSVNETDIESLKGRVSVNENDIDDLNNRLQTEVDTRGTEIDDIYKRINVVDVPIRNIMINSSFSQAVSGFATSIAKSGTNQITDLYTLYSATATNVQFAKKTYSAYRGHMLNVKSVVAKGNNDSYIEVKSDIPMEFEGCVYTLSFVAKNISGVDQLYVEVVDGSQTFTTTVALNSTFTEYNFKVDKTLHLRTDFTNLSSNKIYVRFYFANSTISSPAGANFEIGQLQIVPKHQDYKYYPKSPHQDEIENNRFFMWFPKGYHNTVRRYGLYVYCYINNNGFHRGTCNVKNMTVNNVYLYEVSNLAESQSEEYLYVADAVVSTTSTVANGFLNILISTTNLPPMYSTVYVPQGSIAYLEFV